MVNILPCARACKIFPILPGEHRLEFLCAITSYLRHLAKLWYLYDFVRFHDLKFSRARACASKFPGFPGSAPITIFCAGLLPIFVILSNWGTCAISPDLEKVNGLARARVCINFTAHLGAHRLEFSRAIASLIRYLA